MINRYRGNSGEVEHLPGPGSASRPAQMQSRQDSQPARENAVLQHKPEKPVQAQKKSYTAGIQRQPAGLSERGKAGGLLEGLSKKLDLSRMETEDMILLLILYLLYRESGDEDMLIMMGAMFLL